MIKAGMIFAHYPAKIIFWGGASVNSVRNLLYTSCVLFFVKLNRPVKEIFNCILVVTIFGALFLVPGLSLATSVTIGWDPNTEAGIAGYRIYYGEASGDYWFQQDVGNKTGHAVNDLEEGKTYYFAVTAYNLENHESDYSKELTYTVPFESPTDPDCCGQEPPPPVTPDPEAVQNTLTSSADGSGSVNLYPAGGIYDEGTEVQLTATAGPGWEFSGWSGDLTNTTNPATITMDADMNVTANFIEIPDDDNIPPLVKIWLEAESGYLNAPMKNAADQEASSGEFILIPSGNGNNLDPYSNAGYAEYTFQVPASGGYVIWGRVNAAHGGSDSFFVSMDGTEYALWDTQISNTWVWDQVANRGVNDPIVVQLDSGEHSLIIKHREPLTKIDKILITNDLSYTPEGLGDDINPPPVTVQYTLTVNAADSGSVSLNPAGGFYEEGTAVQLTATADPGWEFSGWSGDLTNTTNPATITMDADMNVTANFVEIEDEPAMVEILKPVQTSSSSSVLNIGFQLDLENVVDIYKAELKFRVMSTLPFISILNENKMILSEYWLKANELIQLDVTDIALKSAGMVEFKLQCAGLYSSLSVDEVISNLELVIYSGDTGVPVAAFVANPVTGTAPLMVEFDATAAFDSDGQLVEYEWDFGDNSYSDAGARVNHLYIEKGIYTATLTVTDDEGNSDIQEIRITVSEKTYNQNSPNMVEILKPVQTSSSRSVLNIGFQLDLENVVDIYKAELKFRVMSTLPFISILNENKMILSEYWLKANELIQLDVTDIALNSAGMVEFKLQCAGLYSSLSVDEVISNLELVIYSGDN